MKNRLLSIFLIDAYKSSHQSMYPKNTEYIYANLTPRNFKWFRDYRASTATGSDLVCRRTEIIYNANLVRYIIKKLEEEWEENFFSVPWEQVEKEIEEFHQATNIRLDEMIPHYKALHQYGSLPLKIDILDADYQPIEAGTPIITIMNTKPEFYWVVNYIEVWLSSEYWPLMVADNIAYQLWTLYEYYLAETIVGGWGTAFSKPTQFHDFSQRGMSSTATAIKTGLGHLNWFSGSDNIPAGMEWHKYREQLEGEPWGDGEENKTILTSIKATEHSVMEVGGRENEEKVIERLLNDFHDEALSMVVDTYDYWNVLVNILPKFKDKIKSRPQPLVIRGDSGNPLHIICGTNNPKHKTEWPQWRYEAEVKGTIRILDELFGHTLTNAGYKTLKHVRVIYGDGINVKNAEEILSTLERMGYSSENVVFGVGSFMYQYNTRDTLGIAMKTTAIKLAGEEWQMLYKDPITDDGMKKSLKGFINVSQAEEYAFKWREFGVEVQDQIPTLDALEKVKQEEGTLWKTILNN